MISEQSGGDFVFTLGIKKLQRILERNNFCYLISALLMLVGCYIISLPHLFEFQTFDGIVILLTVINVYEIMVIATCAFIIRKLPGNPESATLLFVELLFLLDATFTMNGFMSIQFRPGLIVLGASLVAAIVKMYALEAAARAKVFHRLKAVLIPAIVFTLSFQPCLALSRGHSHNRRELLSYALWAIYGSLPLLLHFTRANLGQLSGWKSAGFRRAMLAAALILPGIQLGGQIWVYRAPFSCSFLVPLLISCLVILPDIFKKLSAFEVNTIRFAGAGALILGFGLADESHWQLILARHEFVLSATRLNLAFAGSAFLLMWMRDDQPIQLSVGCALSVLALMGHDFQSIAGFFWDPDWAMLAASIPIAHLWLHYNRGYWRLLGVATFYIFCAANGLEKRTQFQCAYEAACYWPILAFALSLLVGLSARNWQMILLGVVFCIGVSRYPVDDSASVIYFVAGLSSVWAARFILKNNTFIVIAAYYGAAAYLRFGLPQPKSHVNWGWIVIGFAFLVFGAAFLITRNQVRRIDSQT